MKRLPPILPRLAMPLVLAAVFLAPPARAQGPGQIISFADGWNALWLEVEPVYEVGDEAGGVPLAPGDARIGAVKAPGDVFPPEVLMVLSPKPLAGSAEFFAEDPASVTTFNQDSWDVWRRSDPVGDNTLGAVTGNRPYLVETSGVADLTIEGTVRFFRPKWTPDRYNLIGFGLVATPTFGGFFDPSGGRHGATLDGENRIFRLDAASGNWQAVAGTDTMAPNEAYWIFSSGPSDYMGPVAVGFDGAGAGRLDFGGPADVRTVDTGVDALDLDLEEIVFTNLRAAGEPDAAPELDLITPDPGPGALNLHVVRPAPGSLAFNRGNQVDTSAGPTGSPSDLGEIVGPQTTAILTLGAQRNWALGEVGRTNIYRLRTGAGTAMWLPIRALNTDVLPSTDVLPPDQPSSVAGLWVGEVVVSGATSFVEDGAPVRAAAVPAPVRVILHSDATGAVRLLSQVTIMQTRSADPDVAPVPVLVVDRNRIPFFEGIRERQGKLVGIRLEAVAFDMPRDIDPAAQSDDDPLDAEDDLLDMIVAESTSPVTNWLSGQGLYPDRASVDEAAIDSYLLFRGIRPPALKEVYELALPVEGGLGVGKTVRTTAGTLALDPFHRSNPFRHAFHQKHPKGPRITRELTIVLDSGQPVPGRLTGTYREDILGLTKGRLTLTGSIELQRVSPVATLEGAQ